MGRIDFFLFYEDSRYWGAEFAIETESNRPFNCLKEHRFYGFGRTGTTKSLVQMIAVWISAGITRMIKSKRNIQIRKGKIA